MYPHPEVYAVSWMFRVKRKSTIKEVINGYRTIINVDFATTNGLEVNKAILSMKI